MTEWWFHLPAALWLVWVFVLGLGVGSFLNVLIARLPVGKTPVWPTASYCFGCRRPLGFWDNLPVYGYLTRRGRCRMCGARFSPRYMAVELLTAAAFVALFAVEVLAQATGGPDALRPWHHAPGLRFTYFSYTSPLPSFAALAYFAYHALLLALLIACSAIDLEHRVIPHELTYLGVLVGLVGSVLMPWPWPSVGTPDGDAWLLAGNARLIPTGATLWPAWVPADSFPPGSWQLGLLNGVVGAAVGTGLVRGFKFLFEYGYGQEALGLGDADLMMMCGAFLGWPVVVLGFFAGAVLTLVLVLPGLVWSWMTGRPGVRELPFGPGLAGGVVLVWFGWPVANGVAQRLYHGPLLVASVVLVGGGLLAYGLVRGGGRVVEDGS
jgi:leader peptidase (prepilin peptidase)/N-methyltransferase